MTAERERSGLEIAVIGLAGRFPGAPEVEALWRNLRDGVESIRRLDTAELLAAGRTAEDVDDPAFVPAHGVLDGFDRFDAEFFGYRPSEAEALDPQHRIFLEIVWEALEDAGCDPAGYRGLIGVFAGSSANHYLYEQVRRNPAVMARVGEFQAAYANLMDHLATRVSYKLDLGGPSFAIQSACSTSLVAVHVACQQLLAGACDVAIAGGISLTLPIEWGYRYEDGMIRSPDGHCRAFDAQAQGCLKGDGAGVVVLKRLEDALADGDRIDAVILGSAVNNDGADKVGYTAPGLDGQVRVIEAAQAAAGVDAETIGYVEAHGTGTPIGDPIEVAALTQVFRRSTERRQFCGLGSIKTNIGHLDAAAGIAGLIKAVLALRHRTQPANLHYRNPNPGIDFASSPFRVVDRTIDWPAQAWPRRAGVSSFGIGGTNAHVVLEEAPAVERSSPEKAPQALVLSARTAASLDAMTARLADHLASHRDLPLGDVAFTLQAGRRAFARRRAVVARDVDDAIAALRDPARYLDGTAASTPAVAFLFPGQGAQYVGMARGLYDAEPRFRAEVDACARKLVPHLGFDLRELLHPGGGDAEVNAERLRRTDVAQPALFVIEHALAQWLIAHGLAPAAMIGHSVGEYVAACVAGVVALDDALALVATRGRLMQAQRAGAMLAVPLPANEVRPLLGDALDLAAENAPSSCVVAGPVDAVAALETVLQRSRGVASTRLHASHAFHSRMMEPVVAPLLAQWRTVQVKPPQRRFISTVTGTWFTDADARDPEHWARNVRDPVRYSQALRTLLEQRDLVLLEVGPGTTLISLARKHVPPGALVTAATLRHPNDPADDSAHLLASLGRAWSAGVDLRWAALQEGTPRRRVALPTYAFQRQRYWVDPVVPDAAPARGARLAPEDWFQLPSWTRSGRMRQAPTADESWLIVAPDRSEGEPFALALGRAGVPSGILSHADLADDVALAARLALVARGRSERRIVFVAGAGEDGGFGSLLRLARALAAAPDVPVALTVVTVGAFAVLGNEAIQPERVLAAGIAHVLPAECEHVRCRVVDVDPADSDSVTRVIDETLDDAPGSIVAYRHGQRWRFALERVRRPSLGERPARLRAQGAYLVTGGLGAMGLALAEHLARTVQARLVLAARSPFPARSAWSEWRATHREDERIACTIARLEQLEALGAKVTVVQADVADPVAVDRLRRCVRDTVGALNGIVHAAGVAGGGVIALQDPARAAQVFAPKVRGTRLVVDAFRDDGLDFVMLCSSLTSFVPRPGRADYTAANLFLDAFAQAERGIHVVAINWDNWTEAGMARDAANGTITGLTNAEGVDAFARVLSQDWRQVVVSAQDVPAVPAGRVMNPSISPPAIAPAATDAAPAAGIAQPGAEALADAPCGDTEKSLAAIWRDLLGVPSVGRHDNFFDLGGDSVVGIQLVSRARRGGIEISAKQVFEHPTVAALAEAARPALAPEPAPPAQADAEGTFGLAPIQSWFFAQPLVSRDRWNLAATIEAAAGLRIDALRAAVDAVLRSHDALACRFVPGETWRQRIAADAPPRLDVVDVGEVTDAGFASECDRIEQELHARIDIVQGPLVQCVLLERGRERAGRLLVVAHHLAVDVPSLRVLAEELDDAYGRALRGEALAPRAGGTTFRSWLLRLERFVAAGELDGDVAQWSALEAFAPARLPCPANHAGNVAASARVVRTSVDAATTHGLLDAGREAGGAVLALLLGALADVLGEWADVPHVWIDVEGHGRDAFASDVDVARTVGWFTAAYPLPFARGATLGDSVALAAHRLRDTPPRRYGYGALRFLHPSSDVRAAMARLPQPQVVFLYQGRLRSRPAGTTPLQLQRIDAAHGRHGDALRSHVFEIDARMEEGVLHVDWHYSEALHDRVTIERLARAFAAALSMLAASEQSAGRTATPAATARTAPLSFAQERIWFLEQLAPGAAIYNKHAEVRLTGDFDQAALSRAVARLVERHETLRTRFDVVDGIPVQVIEPAATAPVPTLESRFESLDVAERDGRSLARIREPFDLAAGPPWRVALHRVAPREHLLALTFHHIITDAWSVQVFIRELGALYASERDGRNAALVPLSLTFAAFATRQRASLEGAAGQGHLAYWKATLAGLQPLDLPTDRPRPAVQSFDGRRLPFTWPPALAASLRALARATGASMFMALLALFKVLLQRYAAHDDVAVGVPVADRPEIDTEHLIGPLVNNLVIRTDLSGNPVFRELLGRVRDRVLAAHEHRDLPFEKLVRALHPERDRSRSPLFQVMFAFMNVPVAPDAWADLDVATIEHDNGTAEFDLSLYCYDAAADGTLRGWIEYSTALFDPSTVERMAGHLRQLAEALVDAPDRRIGDVCLLTAPEVAQLHEWNRTDADIPLDAGLHERFEQHARREPVRIAVEFDGAALLTYGELDRRANQLARHLRGLGVGRDVRVAICTDRNLEMLVGLLGILKAGGAYVPLDPAYPAERLAYMLADSGAPILLTEARLQELLPCSGVHRLRLDSDWPRIAAESEARLAPVHDGGSLAYVIYTSGSTGKPKGVAIEHRAVVNFLHAIAARPGLVADDRLLAVTTISFDIHVLELFGPLAAGATVVVASREAAADPHALIEQLATKRISVMQATPSTWRMLLDAGWTGRAGLRALCGGEALPPDLARALLERCASLWNLYGPTEATVWACMEPVAAGTAPIAVGRPLANVRCHVLDPRGQPQPVGLPGELCIGGACLARGYLGRPELTAEQFVADPFVAGARTYRTGDLARFLADGRLVVIGRVDHQVKLRGHRVELGEVEAVLAEHVAVAQCTALVREDRPGDQRLVLYAVARGPERPDVATLRSFAAARLPDYMLPSAVVWLDGLPQTPNGKIDRKALPPPVPPERAAPAEELPLSAAERVFADIFAEVLGVTGVARYDNFFDLGGHSLLAMRVVDRFQKASGIRMQPGELFQQSVGQLAAHYGPRMQAGRPAETSRRGLGNAMRSLFGRSETT